MTYINFAAADAQYFATITFDDSYYSSNNMKCIQLDCINDITINSQNQITQFPLVSGKISADHIIQQPRTVTMSGKFGRNASYSGTNNAAQETFKSIQRLFERIKNQGYLCTIQKVHKEKTDFETFDELENMVLTSIVWTEQNNTMSFNFTFTEVFLVSVKDALYEDTDKNAPVYRDLINTNLNQAFFSEGVAQTVFDVASNAINTAEYAIDTAYAIESAIILVSSGVGAFFSFGVAAVMGGAAELVALDAYEKQTKNIENAKKQIEVWREDPQKAQLVTKAVKNISDIMPTFLFSEDADQVCYMTVDDVGIRIEVKINRGGVANAANISIYDYSNGNLLGQKNNIYLSPWRFEDCASPIAQINDYGIYSILLFPSQTDEINVTEMIKEAQIGDLTRYGLIVTNVKPYQFRALLEEELNKALGIE